MENSTAGCVAATREGAPPRLLKLPEVAALCGLHRSEIYARVAAGTFPRQLKLGLRASAWVESEVAAWVFERIAARDSQPREVSA